MSADYVQVYKSFNIFLKTSGSLRPLLLPLYPSLYPNLLSVCLYLCMSSINPFTLFPLLVLPSILLSIVFFLSPFILFFLHSLPLFLLLLSLYLSHA